ncbi:MAG TPA: MFS transporter [Polyangiaceae bacterium]|nr:MFS transporter [Polyangiaceae bacterium]
MAEPWKRVQRTFLVLTVSSTLASSFIWGINTLFLLDAGLSNAEAFAANAFFTAGEVIFEVPTGVVADTWGRRASYLLGTGTLLVSTLLYLAMWRVHAPFWGWALASALLGLGFTFFSGATEAWLVDALAFSGFTGHLESVFSKAQTVTGAAMLVGSVAGGFIAQMTSLGVPYLIRSGMLLFTFLAAWLWMKDQGFTPDHGKGPIDEVRKVLRASIDSGWRNPPVRWLMLAALISGGVGIYAFYALQPYLLELYGDKRAYGIAGLAAAIIAGTQILGGLAGPFLHRIFSRRTHVLVFASVTSAVSLAIIARTPTFALAIGWVVIWGMAFAIGMPVRQAYLNGLVPSAQRATVLSSYNLMESAGGVIAQPSLGRVADTLGYPAAYLACAAIQVASIPFLLLARRENAPSDPIESDATTTGPTP